MTRSVSFHHFVGGDRASAMEHLVGVFNASQSQVVVRAKELRDGIRDDATERLGLLPPYLGNSLPEVVMVYAEFIATLADQERIRPLDDLIAGAEGIEVSDFVDGVMDTVRYRGHIWGLPIEGDPHALYCNRSLLERAGVSAAPATWGEVMAASVMLAADTDGDGRTDRFGCSHHASDVPLLMWQFGADLVNEERTRIAFDSEEGTQALKCHADVGACCPAHAEFERGDVGLKLGMLDYYLSGRCEHLDYEIAPLPRGRRAANGFGGADSTLCLALACRERECERAGWRFLRWFTTQEGLMEWVRATGHLPLVGPVLASDEYQEFVARRPRLHTFIKQLPACRARPCMPEYPMIKWAIHAAAHEARQDGRGCTLDEARETLRRYAVEAQEALDRRVKV
ncbi:MAG TPA: extracellular solute-binding protein [Armatimonadota bacterium]|nr:extracellular solute-binding protein [Armatimonadota bacterium]